MSDVVFSTERLLVRPYEERDAPFVLDMYSRWDVQRFLGVSPRLLASLEDAHSTIARWQSVSNADRLLGIWAVTLRSGTPVGTVILKMAPLSSSEKPPPPSNDHEVGWHLHPDHWGRGYATEATRGAMRRASDAGVSQVVALIVPGNDRSKRVAERLGMRHEGLTDRYYSFEAELYTAALSRDRPD